MALVSNQIKQLAPRHLEIMRRKMLGQKNIQIGRELGMSESRLSIIINAPLFKLELRKKMLESAEKVTEIQENIMEGARLGTQLHRKVLEGDPLTHATLTEQKVRSANVMTSFALRLIGSSNGGGGGNGVEEAPSDNLSYEERLQRVTVTKTERITHKGQNGGVAMADQFVESQMLLNDSLPQVDEVEID